MGLSARDKIIGTAAGLFVAAAVGAAFLDDSDPDSNPNPNPQITESIEPGSLPADNEPDDKPAQTGSPALKERFDNGTADERYDIARSIAEAVITEDNSYDNAWAGYEQDVVSALLPYVDSSPEGGMTAYYLTSFINENQDNLPGLWDIMTGLLHEGNLKQRALAVSYISTIAADDENKMPQAWNIMLDHLDFTESEEVRAYAHNGIGYLAILYPEKTQDGLTILLEALAEENKDQLTRSAAAQYIAYIGINNEEFEQLCWDSLIDAYNDYADPAFYPAIGVMGAAEPRFTDAAWDIVSLALKEANPDDSEFIYETGKALDGVNNMVRYHPEKARFIVESDLVVSHIDHVLENYEAVNYAQTSFLTRSTGVITSAAISHQELFDELAPEAITIIERVINESDDPSIEAVLEIYLDQIEKAQDYYEGLEAEGNVPVPAENPATLQP